ncbi:MAG: Mut7-C RNAse domain-containing protein [Chloroflexota bacterium]
MSTESPYRGEITIAFHGALTDFFKSETEPIVVHFQLHEKTSLKHIVEALGVPHPEIGKIILNDKEVSLSYHPVRGDYIHLHPWQSKPPTDDDSEPRFILDNHLGKLTAYLRLLGIDALYSHEYNDERIAQIAAEQDRIVLTRDRGLLKRKVIQRGYCVRQDNPLSQLAEIIDHFQLLPYLQPFRRCPRCNGLLVKVDKQSILDQLLPLTRIYYNDFSRCSNCGQIYWKGSHYDRIKTILHRFTSIKDEEK